MILITLKNKIHKFQGMGKSGEIRGLVNDSLLTEPLELSTCK